MAEIESFDADLLPNRALVDTGALLRGLGQRPKDPRSPVCRGFIEAMQAHRRKILVSTISYGEMLRGRPGVPPPPAAHYIELVSYDLPSAQELQKFPPDHIRAVAESKEEYRLLLQDSMILACAIRHKATAVIALDGPLLRLAAAVGMPAARPEQFLSRQAPLPFEE